MILAQPVIHIDDSDIVKPDGYKFEYIGLVPDGSERSLTKNVYKKVYHVTETTVLTHSGHPVASFLKSILLKKRVSLPLKI